LNNRGRGGFEVQRWPGQIDGLLEDPRIRGVKGGLPGTGRSVVRYFLKRASAFSTKKIEAPVEKE
jgi:hypothetical protein